MFVTPKRTLKEETVSANGIRSTIEMPSSARRGELLRIDAVWTNASDSTVSFMYGPSLPTNVIVFTAVGEPVWASHGGGMVTDVGASAELAPGEDLRFTRYWELVDEDGFGLPPGDYLVLMLRFPWRGPDEKGLSWVRLELASLASRHELELALHLVPFAHEPLHHSLKRFALLLQRHDLLRRCVAIIVRLTEVTVDLADPRLRRL